MDLSGLRETISTREKIFPARSRMVGSVRGKSIMVPRIAPLGRESIERILPLIRKGLGKGRGARSAANRRRLADNFRLQKGSISATMQQTAEVPVSRPRWLGVSRLPVNDRCFFSALRDSKVGSGQKEWAGEEALYRESSVFRDGRAAQRVVLAGWRHTLGRQPNPRPIHGPVTWFCLRRGYER